MSVKTSLRLLSYVRSPGISTSFGEPSSWVGFNEGGSIVVLLRLSLRYLEYVQMGPHFSSLYVHRIHLNLTTHYHNQIRLCTISLVVFARIFPSFPKVVLAEDIQARVHKRRGKPKISEHVLGPCR